MSVPDVLRSHLDGEQVAARVSLGGEDVLFVTPTRTLIYRSEGLLSDESVEEYPHDAERLAVEKGRRKTKLDLDYGLDGAESFSVPSSRADEALHPVLAGVLNAAGVTDPGETIKQTYQFSELTLVVTSARVVKHIGEAVWDDEFEEFHFEDVTAVDVEEGSVSSQLVIDVDGRPQRIKTPNDETRHVYEHLVEALVAYHDVGSYGEFEAMVAADADDEEPEVATRSSVSFDENIEPIDANPPELDADGRAVEAPPEETEPAREAATSETAATESAATEGAPAEGRADARAGVKSGDAETAFAESGFEAASSELEGDELAELVAAVERQNRLLVKQQRTIEQLVERLNRDR